MTAKRIMVIRHAEKPSADRSVRGVNVAGVEDPNSLSVRGWQRAGALIAFFGAPQGAQQPCISRPAFLFAPAATPQAPSVRSEQTLAPLAAMLGLSVATPFRQGEEKALALELHRVPGTALVAWEHKTIAELARELIGRDEDTPQAWPDDRFDMVWVFEGEEGRLRFSQVPQLLMDGDSSRTL
ncbi:MAG: uncharacterized protein JWQ03_1545 [Variovorax sp.]|nr:uncharacterized protein [Variovorax sp.]